MESKKLNVAIVTDYLAPYQGNFFYSILELHNTLVKCGGKVIYLFSSSAKNIEWIKLLKDNGYIVDFLPDQSINKAISIMNLLKKYNLNIIHSHFCLPKTQVIVKMICSIKQVYLIQHYHNHYALNGNILKKHLLKWSLNGNFNIGCSESVFRSIPFKKKIAVTNSIVFKRLDQFDQEFIYKKNSEETKVIIMLGFDYYRKGVDLAIRAMQTLVRRYKVCLKIVVSVNQDRIKEYIIRDFGAVPDWVEILPPREDIATYYKAADIFLQTAREEGFCYALVEAVYCNLYCISSKIDGVPNQIPNLIEYESEDITGLINACETVLTMTNSNEDKRESYQYVINKFGIEYWIDQIINCYNLVIGRS